MTDFFSVRIPPPVKRSCIAAIEGYIAQQHDWGNFRNLQSLLGAFENLKGYPIRLENEQASLLDKVLQFYLKNGPLRPTSKDHQELSEFRFALTDYIDTCSHEFVPKLMEALRKNGIIPANPDSHEKSFRRKRDAIFREMMGTSATNNIWDTNTQRCLSNHWVSLSEKLDKQFQGRLQTKNYSPKSLVDDDVDQELTGGEPCRFNEQMQSNARTPQQTILDFGKHS